MFTQAIWHVYLVEIMYLAYSNIEFEIFTLCDVDKHVLYF